jgi:hypothetical protein
MLHGRTGKDLARIQDGQLIGDPVAVNTPAVLTFDAWLAWRLELGAHWLELGVKAFNLLDNPFRDEGIQVRPDGVEFGGELMGRRALFFLRGVL